MAVIPGLFVDDPFLLLPSDLLGWLGILLWLGGISILLWLWRGFQRPWNQLRILLFVFLIIAAPIASLSVGVRLPVGNALPLPSVVMEPQGPALMIFSAIPWVLAAGLLGPLPAAIIAAITGICLAYFGTHSIFTPFEYTFLALIFSAVVMQSYRTLFYRILRFPTAAAVLIAFLCPFIYLPNIIFITQGSLASRIDYGLLNLMPTALAFGVPLILGGIVAEFVRVSLPEQWGGQPPWRPSPAESSLETRLIFWVVPLAIALILALVIGDWISAGNAAEQMLQERMENSADLAAQNVPYFLDTGQSLILQFAQDERLIDHSLTTAQMQDVLAQLIRSAPYFRQLYLLDSYGDTIAGYPGADYLDAFVSQEERAGIILAVNGVLIQVYTIPPDEGDTTAQVSFIASMDGLEGKRVLVGRSDLDTNPFAQPILTSLDSMQDVEGVGILLDEYNRILYHPDPNYLMQSYTSETIDQPAFFDAVGSDGSRQYVQQQPSLGRPWAVVITAPMQSAQQLAISIASPLVIMIVLIAIVSLILLRFVLGIITGSLKSLSVEANRIADGKLDQSLTVEGDDEVAHLRSAFEQMRVRLKGRLDELNRLLLVSQGVASSLEMEEAVKPILEAALSTESSAARVVLTPDMLPDTNIQGEKPTRFGLGPDADHFQYLDDHILLVMRNRDESVFTDKDAATLNISPGFPLPASFMAVALRHENLYYGVLWVAFKQEHEFSGEEKRFLHTLAGQAALAAANAHLFMTAEIGRQRLATILASTPDPVLVTDHRDHLLLLNPAALEAFQMTTTVGVGKPVIDVFTQPELVSLMKVAATEQETIEISLNNRIYLATASSITADGQSAGRVCVLQDVTQFKELDALKSEFVSTVSHDLRSPLTLMRGYATMLEMVGQLNEQQSGYVEKIVIGVESMSKLVNNLLDLGRIEAEVGLRLETLSMHDLIDQVVDALAPQATQKKIKVHVAIAETAVPLVEADPALLQQAMQNLVENAIKYTPTKGQVWVSAKFPKERMLFEVRDTGIGIAPVDQPRLFEKFYRSASREAKRERGTGLGLAIVKSIVERHGGEVGVRSQLGKGSVFYFVIPIRQQS